MSVVTSIKRDGGIYKVVDQRANSYAVIVNLNYADGTTEPIKCWWPKEMCQPIFEKEEEIDSIWS